MKYSEKCHFNLHPKPFHLFPPNFCGQLITLDPSLFLLVFLFIKTKQLRVYFLISFFLTRKVTICTCVGFFFFFDLCFFHLTIYAGKHLLLDHKDHTYSFLQLHSTVLHCVDMLWFLKSIYLWAFM